LPSESRTILLSEGSRLFLRRSPALPTLPGFGQSWSSSFLLVAVVAFLAIFVRIISVHQIRYCI
jgi:hypothetical protein